MRNASAKLFLACALFFLCATLITTALIAGIARSITPAQAAAEETAAESCAGYVAVAPSNILNSFDEASASANGTGTQPLVPTSPSAQDPSSTFDCSSLVPVLLQYPDMPAGCEIYSLAAVLQALGFDADPHDIARDHVPYTALDGNYATAYSGSPYRDGEGLPPAIVRAGNSYLESSGSPFRFFDATNAPFEDLLALADRGLPVLVWTTMGMADPGFAAPLPSYTFYPLEHCVVLQGSGPDGTVRLMDPQAGSLTVDAAQFSYLYEQCGSMAVTLGCSHERS